MSLPAISNLMLHYDASTLSLNNLDDVNQWDDISGNDHHLTPISNNPPQYLSEGSSLSGNPSVKYNSDATLRTFLPVMNQPVTYIIAGLMPTSGYLYDGTANSRRHSHWAAGVNEWGMFANSVDSPISVPNSTGENGIMHTLWNGSSSRIYWNNNLEASPNPGTRGTDGFVLGARFSDSSYSNGEFYEVLVYRKTLTSSERTNVYNYLYDKWFTEPSLKVLGVVNNDGIPVEGSTVRLFNQTTNQYLGKTLSNSSGEYEFEINTGIELTDKLHVTCEWEDNGTLYNSLSYPFIEPFEVD